MVHRSSTRRKKPVRAHLSLLHSDWSLQLGSRSHTKESSLTKSESVRRSDATPLRNSDFDCINFASAQRCPTSTHFCRLDIRDIDSTFLGSLCLASNSSTLPHSPSLLFVWLSHWLSIYHAVPRPFSSCAATTRTTATAHTIPLSRSH